jgi:hypothetical protein
VCAAVSFSAAIVGSIILVRNCRFVGKNFVIPGGVDGGLKRFLSNGRFFGETGV